ncbi:uncharacterized protein LOC131023481 [Salvia miltiorrhiza]|uniref:uncharacterized protein LOC131023481 n=1 Tax=Salvia miltiorrhiza TaxID=226208 RepID=UPI0025AC6DF0|nr:uncharacterized protein LOC131023481 [Salvia miltiorrhiza]
MLNSVWKAKAPQKAIMTAWRVLKNRIPTCDNLRKRQVPLCEEDTKCKECGMQEESAYHVFLACPKMEEAWNDLQKWLGTATVRPNSIESHFGTFAAFGKEKKVKNLLLAIWVCCIWLLWKKRNEKRFEYKEWDPKKLVMEVKIRMWSWNRIFGIVEDVSNLDSWCADKFVPRMM